MSRQRGEVHLTSATCDCRVQARPLRDVQLDQLLGARRMYSDRGGQPL